MMSLSHNDNGERIDTAHHIGLATAATNSEPRKCSYHIENLVNPFSYRMMLQNVLLTSSAGI